MRWKEVISLFIVASFALTTYGGGNNETTGARSQAMGGASVALVDGWSVTNNVGALGFVNQYSIQSAYESRYFLPEAGFSTLSFAGPLGGGSMGLVAHTYGYAAYRESRVGLVYARQLADYVSLGVQLNYVQVRIANDYGQTGNVVGAVGLLFRPKDEWTIGVQVYNPSRARLAEFDDERIPTTLSVGTAYKFSDKVKWVGQVEKDLTFPINIRSGLEYEPMDDLFLRVGYSTLNGSFAMGIGYLWKSVQIDISNQWDQSIGFGGTVSLGYTFGKRKAS